MKYNETFKTHPDIPIEVSNYGKVKLPYKWHPQTAKDYYLDKRGNLMVTVRMNGTVKFYSVLKLFMETYLPGKRLTSFRDKDKTNICLQNIRYKNK